jgi:hypothetical protein
VRIYLTAKGAQLRERVQATADQIDTRVRKSVANGDFKAFQNVIAALQTMSTE